MMGRGSIPRTGAGAPGVDRLSPPARTCLTGSSSLTQSREYTVKAGGTKDVCGITGHDFESTTGSQRETLCVDPHLLVPDRRGRSELKVSATIFHVPSDCFSHTAMSLPLSFIGAPFGAL